jgi:hypothetical protein
MQDCASNLALVDLHFLQEFKILYVSQYWNLFVRPLMGLRQHSPGICSGPVITD